MSIGIGICITKPCRVASGAPPLPAGAIAHWDFSDAASLSFSSGTAISGATDKTGNGHNAAQATVDLQPSLMSAGINGLSVADCDKDWLVVPGDVLFQPGRISVFIVYKCATSAHITSLAGPELQWAMFLNFTGTDVYLRTAVATWITTTSPVGNYVDGDPHIYGMTVDNPDGQLSMWLDGTVMDSSSATSARADGATALQIGAYAGHGFTGQLGEMIIYKDQLGDTAAIHAYLAAKWGITL